MRFGPLYCETPNMVSYFPVEPINTITNIFAILFGLIGFYITYRHAPRSYELYFLSFLLVAVGVGSTLWHGLRESWALSFDVVPGIFFLLFATFFWTTALHSKIAGYAFLMLFIGSVYFSFVFLTPLINVLPTPFIPLFIVVTLFALVLAYFTFKKFGRVGWYGISIIATGLSAAFFRTLDLYVCDVVPFGTHFLWHIFLSTCAFLCIVLLLSIHARKKI